MKHANLWKQIVAVLLVLVLSVGLITPSIAVDADEATTRKVTFEQVDNDSVDIELPVKDRVATDEEVPQYADTDIVRVSIVLSDASTLEKGFTAEQIAGSNTKAVKYRQKLESKQEKMESTISKKVLDGESLDVVWNLTLAANIISANVEYGQIEAIEKLSGVEQVLIETVYEPCVIKDSETTDPNMSTSDEMIGSTAAWAAGYTGEGSKIAIIDTGADTDHPSLNPDAFTYAVGADAKLMTAADTEKVLSQLNAVKKRAGTTAQELYINAKIPYGFNYVDNGLDVTHDNDIAGDHGSHVTGIAAGNRYIKNADGTYSDALDSVLTQGVAPDAQVLVMKVFGQGGGARDSDYMAAIEDAMLLGADSANLSLGSGNPGYSHNSKAAYQALLEQVVESGMVVAISAGNSGHWFENTPYGYPYAESVSWQTSGSPGSFTNSFNVASADNIGTTADYIEVGGEKIFYNESLEGNDGKAYSNQAIKTIAGEHEFVYIDAIGTEAEFAAVKDVLQGKIAICNRGEISFYVKAENAVNNGAIATIVANNEAGMINMDFSDYSKTEPAVAITLADALMIKEKATAVKDEAGKLLYYTGKLTVADKPGVTMNESGNYTVSDFSSWGVPGSLKLKPEITAPGGNIYSLKNGGGYQNMSGTSMASPQIAGMAAVVAQYIKANGLAEKTGLTVRALTQSLLMSTAEPMIEDQGNGAAGYYPVIRQGAGLANVGAAISSGSYLLMDENATDSYKDGKIKVELGDDADRDGLYTFGFTIYNMENTDTAFTLDSDFFTQDVFDQRINSDNVIYFEDSFTSLIPANVTWNVNGETVEIEDASDLEHCDFNGNGKINSDDGQALLDYVTGVRKQINDQAYADFDTDGNIDTYDAYLFFKRLGKSAVVVPANGSVHVTVTAQLSKEMLDAYDEVSYGTGSYVEGFVYATELSSAEGEQGTQHSIPVLGYYGSWSDPSMYDIGSYLDYAYGTESRVPYMFAASDRAPYFQALTVQYEGDPDPYFFGGNPYVEENFYHEDRNAYNPDTTTFAKLRFSLIRNAANGRLTIVDDSGKVYVDSILDQSVDSAFYYVNGESWQGTNASLNVNSAPNAPEGSKLTVSMTMVPEYYVDYSGSTAVTNWDALTDGATVSYTAYVDKTAPEVSDVSIKESLVDGMKQLLVEASDNRYIAAAILYDYDAGKILDRAAGSPEDAKLGDSTTIALDASKIDGVSHLMLCVYDYADNYSTFKINFNKEELDQDVRVELSDAKLSLYKNQTAILQAEVTPFGTQPDGVTWSSSDETVATVNQKGIVTALNKGVAVITATSKKDANAMATCTVTVNTLPVTFYGTLQDKDGDGILYSWNLNEDETWKRDAYLANGGELGAAASTLDTDQNQVIMLDAQYNLHLVDRRTGADIAKYPGASSSGENFELFDIAYSELYSNNEPYIYWCYGTYLSAPMPVSALSLSAYDISDWLSETGASCLTAIANLGAYTVRVGTSPYPADIFFALDNAGYVWTLAYVDMNDRVALYSLGNGSEESSLPSLSYPGLNDHSTSMTSMVYSPEGSSDVLYVSYFDGDTNQIYRLAYDEETAFWNAALIGDFGSDVWPASIFEVKANGTDSSDDTTGIAARIESAKLETMGVLTTAVKSAEKKVNSTGSMNVAPATKSEPMYTLDAPTEKAAAESNVTVSADEKTVTVNVIAESGDATTNGLATVEYDSKVLTLTDVTMFADYTSHNDEDGKVTLGYADLDGVPAGTVVATLTFSVDPTKVETDPQITIHQTEINRESADITQVLTAEFHKDTEIRDAKAPTCTVEGYTGDTYCTVCGKKLASGEAIPASGHDFGEWTVVTAPTCQEKGLKKRTCKTCDYTETMDLDPTGHEWEDDFTVDHEPTCTEDGSKSIHCKNCDAVKDSTVLPATGHEFGEWTVSKPATCTDDGEEIRSCEHCDATESRIVAALGHDPEIRNAKEAICTEKGYTGDTYCKTCNELLEKGKEIAALGHDYKNGKCTRCGEKQINVKTGDDSNLMLWIAVLTMSAAAAAFAVAIVLRKKREN